jgi:hypothetical protein
MTEELRPIGGETRSEEAAGAGEIERQAEAGPFGAPEQTPEQIVEMPNERPVEIPAKTLTAQQVVPEPADEEQVQTDAKAVYDETDAEARVTKLVSLAETKGVEHAVRVAQKLNDFYVLDRMHDELSGKFYDALKAKGLIKE